MLIEDAPPSTTARIKRYVGVSLGRSVMQMMRVCLMQSRFSDNDVWPNIDTILWRGARAWTTSWHSA